MRDRPSPSSRAPGMLFGAGVALLAFLHVPASVPALNAFDPGKRLAGWLFCALCFWIARRVPCGGSAWTSRAVVALAGWMLARAALRPDPFLELETLWGWLALPVAWTAGARMAPVLARPAITRALLVCAVIQAGLMLLQRAGWDPVFPDTTRGMDYAPGRMIGAIGYHNQAAEFLLVCAGAFWLSGPRPWFRSAGLAGLGVMLALVASRGALLAAAVAAGLAGLARGRAGWRHLSRGRGAVAGLALSLPVLAAVLLPETRGRLEELARNRESSPAVLSRQLMRGVAAGLWREHPWIGAGPGAFAFSYLERVGDAWPDARDHDFLRVVVPAREAHCDPLQFAAEFGWVGVALAAWALAGGIATLARGRGRAPDEAAAAAWLMGGLGVCGLFNFSWQTAAAGHLGAFMLGWLHTAICRALKTSSPTVSSPGRLPVWAGLATSMLALLWWGRTAVLSVLLAGDGAEARVAAGLRPGPLFPRARAMAGGFLARAGRWPEARAELEAAFARQREVSLLNNLGHVAFHQGRFADAIAHYRMWANSGVDHARALANLSLAAERAGQPEVAMRAVERLHRFWPNQPETDLRRVAALGLRSGRVAPAALILDRWLKAARHHGLTPAAETWNARGSLARAAGDTGRAEECFHTALRINPNLESARRNLAAMRASGTPARASSSASLPQE